MWIFCFHWGTLLSSSQDNVLLPPSFLTISFPKFSGRPWKQTEESPDSKERNAATSMTIAAQKTLKLIRIARAKAARPSARAQLPLQKLLCPPRLPGSLICPRVSEMAPRPCLQAAQPSPSFPCHACHLCILSFVSSLCSVQDISVCFSQWQDVSTKIQRQRQQEREKKWNLSLSFVLLPVTQLLDQE